MVSSPQPTWQHEGGFIAGPWFDVVAFILAPLFALVLGQAVALSGWDRVTLSVGALELGVTSTMLRTLIHAHQVAVLVRTHGNPAIFRQFRARFVLVPAVMMAAMLGSDRVLATVLVVSVFWDIYHSGMQTFGLCRIYDALRGNPASVGRAWDLGLNHVIYVVPMMVGPLVPVQMDIFGTFATLGDTWFLNMPVKATQAVASLRPVLLWGSGLFLVGYAAAWRRLVQRGYEISTQKLLLLGTTAVACVAASGFDVLGQGLLVVNTFHAVQYLALLWHVEGGRVTGRLGLAQVRSGRMIALLVLTLLLVMYGVFVGALPGLSGNQTLARVLLVLSSLMTILHFWYDGFVWSVRKKEAVE